jgi:hypothetical protein
MNDTSPAGFYTEASQMQYINLYFLDATNTVQEVFTTSEDFQNWSIGTLGAQKHVATGMSALTAVWHSHSACYGCPNTLLLVYQDAFLQAQLVNGTQSGWVSYPLIMNPVNGTGFSIVKFRDDPWMTSLRLYYQTSNENLCTHDWFSFAQYAVLGSKSSWRLSLGRLLIFFHGFKSSLSLQPTC